jgi:hypothetical protein
MLKRKTHAELLAEVFKKLEEYNIKSAYYCILTKMSKSETI